MVRNPLTARVKEAMDFDEEAFDTRVAEEADRLKSAVADGAFDNPGTSVGLEYEFYAVDDAGALARIPRDLLDTVGFEKELGIHNAEMQVGPRSATPQGFAAQEAEVKADVAAAQTWADKEGLRLVSDGTWTVPPSGETARRYLSDCIDDDGDLRIAANMSESIRHHVISNPTGSRGEPECGMRIDTPNASLSADTVLPQSLITSAQFHYQIPEAAHLPTYFRYALRIAGPLLALATNSPFLPADLYGDADPERVVEDAWNESRIDVFETVMNRPDDSPGKVRFPEDLQSTAEAIDRIADDRTAAPVPPESVDGDDGEFAHFRLKRGEYWRWVRPVFGGDTPSTANVRIEFRPLPAQPTVRDTIALQAAFTGLLTSLTSRSHPVRHLDWDAAERNFYAATRDGLDADLSWITATGTETRDADELYDDLFVHVRDGLKLCGFADDRITEYLRPLRHRVEDGLTPADWKRREVRQRLRAGTDLEDAIRGMQRTYIDEQEGTLLDGTFVDWTDESSDRSDRRRVDESTGRERLPEA